MEQYISKIMDGIGQQARELLGLYCGAPSAEQIETWFSQVDFDALGSGISCMAAAVCAEHDFAGVPKALAPRIHGLIRYIRTLNAGMTAGLCALGALYTQAGIPMRLQKDTALRLGYPGLCRRHMWQADMAVPEDRYAEAVHIAREAGFTVTESPISTVVRRKNTECIVIYKSRDSLEADARRLTAGGTEFLVPEGDALLVELAEMAFLGLMAPNFQAMTARWIMDLHPFLSAETVDWDAAAAIAAARGTGAKVRLVLECYDTLAPGKLPQGCWERFAGAGAAEKTADILLKCRKLPEKGAKLRRRYWDARLTRPENPGAAMRLFFSGLARSVGRRFRRGR